MVMPDGRAAHVTRLAHTVAEGSLLLRWVRATPGRAEAVAGTLETSFVASAVGVLVGAANGSGLAGLVGTVGQFTRASFGYRWLTSDREPEVVTIELADSTAVVYLEAALHGFVRRLVPAYHRSTVVDTVRGTSRRIRDVPIGLASAVLLVAVFGDFVVTLASGAPTLFGVALRILFLCLLAAGTQVTMSWSEFARTPAGRLLVATLEPPEWSDDT